MVEGSIFDGLFPVGPIELFCVFRPIRTLRESFPGLHLQAIDGESTALARLETESRRIEVYHDQSGAIDFHATIDPAIRPTHPTFERYQDALIDYTEALEGLTGTEQEPVLYRGRLDDIIEI